MPSPPDAASPNKLLFDLGTKHAKLAIDADRRACLSPSLPLFQEAVAHYDTTITHLLKALEAEANAETRRVVETKLAEYRDRRAIMAHWIRDYGAAHVRRDDTSTSATSTSPNTSRPATSQNATQNDRTSAAAPDPTPHTAAASPRGPSTTRTTSSPLAKRAGLLPMPTPPAAAMDVAFGILLAGAIAGVLYFVYLLFHPYLLPALMAAVVATALRPVSYSIQMAIGSTPPPMTDIERERFRKQQLRFGTVTSHLRVGRRIVLFLLLFVLTALRNWTSAMLCAAVVAGVAGAVAAGLALGRVLVKAKVASAPHYATAMLLSLLFGGGAVLGTIYGVGVVKDVAQGLRDTAAFAKRMADETGGAELLASQLDEMQAKVAAAVLENKAMVLEYSGKAREWTGVDLDEAVCLVADAATGDTAELPVVQIKEAVQRQLPQSLDEVKERAQNASARLQELDIDMEPIKEAGLKLLQGVSSGAGDILARIGEFAQRVGAAVTFLGLLPVLLSRERSVVSLLTDIVPLPRRSQNDQIEVDVRTALAALVGGMFRSLVLESAYVYLLFAGFNLNFEFLASLLAGLAATIPLLPPGIVFTVLLGVPQLAAQKRWAEAAAVALLHLVFDSGVDEYLARARQDVRVGSGILNRQLFTLSIVLALPVFERTAVVIGPLLVIFALVVYDIFFFLNAEKHDGVGEQLPRT